MKKQDWSPRDLNPPKNKAVLRLSGDLWWDAMKGTAHAMHSWNFKQWLVRRARARRSRLHIMKQLAWKDPKSDWHLFWDKLIRTHRFPDGKYVSAEIVAEGVIQFLEDS